MIKKIIVAALFVFLFLHGNKLTAQTNKVTVDYINLNLKNFTAQDLPYNQKYREFLLPTYTFDNNDKLYKDVEIRSIYNQINLDSSGNLTITKVNDIYIVPKGTHKILVTTFEPIFKKTEIIGITQIYLKQLDDKIQTAQFKKITYNDSYVITLKANNNSKFIDIKDEFSIYNLEYKFSIKDEEVARKIINAFTHLITNAKTNKKFLSKDPFE